LSFAFFDLELCACAVMSCCLLAGDCFLRDDVSTSVLMILMILMLLMLRAQDVVVAMPDSHCVAVCIALLP
jgi:hypothetical protein